VLYCRTEVDSYTDEPVTPVEDKIAKTMDKRAFSKCLWKTTNMHCLCDIEPGKYNKDFKKNTENHAKLIDNELELNNHIVSKWATKAWLGGVNYISIGFAARRNKHEENEKE